MVQTVAIQLVGTWRTPRQTTVYNKFNVVLFNETYASFHKKFIGDEAKEYENYANVVKFSLLNNLYKILLDFEEHKQVVKFSVSIQSPFDGGEGWFDFEMHPLKNGENTFAGIGIGIFDTTEKHLAVQQLTKSEELFKALVVNSTDAFQLTDEELKIKYVSASVKKILGYDAAEMVDNHFFNLIHPDDKKEISAWLHWLMHNPGIVKPVEVRIKNKTSDWDYIEVNGNNMLQINK